MWIRTGAAGHEPVERARRARHKQRGEKPCSGAEYRLDGVQLPAQRHGRLRPDRLADRARGGNIDAFPDRDAGRARDLTRLRYLAVWQERGPRPRQRHGDGHERGGESAREPPEGNSPRGEEPVTGAVAAAAGGGCHIFSGCGFPAPGLQDFIWKPIFTIGSFEFTKPMLLAILAALIVIGFFWAAFRKPRLIPGRTQSLGEMAILAVRDQILRPSLGRKGDSYLPFLVSLFFFIYIMNLMELIPVFQFPVTSRIGFVWPMVFIVYFLYLYLGFKHQGGWGYIRNMITPGVPAPVLIILIPVELLRFFVFQPFTLGVRLFGNMFAGHLLLTIFTVATWYLLSLSVRLLYAAGSFALAIFVFVLETLVTLLQAFIFTTLTATYIASSVEPAH